MNMFPNNRIKKTIVLSIIQGLLLFFSGFVLLFSIQRPTFKQSFCVNGKTILVASLIAITIMALLWISFSMQNKKESSKKWLWRPYLKGTSFSTIEKRMTTSHICSILLQLVYFIVSLLMYSKSNIIISKSPCNIINILTITFVLSIIIAIVFFYIKRKQFKYG